VSIIKKIIINSILWVAIFCLSFLYSPLLYSFCANEFIVQTFTFTCVLTLAFYTVRSLFLLAKKERNLIRVVKSLGFIILFTVVSYSTQSLKNLIVSDDFFSINLGYRSGFTLFYRGIIGWLTVAFITQKICKIKQLDSKRYFRMGLMSILFLCAIPKFIDDEPIENDWTADELFSNDNVLKSYDQLSKFMETADGGGSELTLKDTEGICEVYQKESVLNDKEQIEGLWNSNKNFIEEFEKLDNFDGITAYKKGMLLLDQPYLKLSQLRELFFLYGCKARLSAEEGNVEKAIETFSKAYSISLKGLKYSSSFINAMIWTATSSISIETAAKLAKTNDFSDLHAQQLLTVMTRMNEDYSLSNALKMEYISLKKVSIHYNSDLNSNPIRKFCFFKINRTLRLLRHYYGIMLEELNSPPFTTDKMEQQLYKQHECIDPTNIWGWIICHIAIPSISSSNKSVIHMKIKSEILRLRLREKANLGTDDFIDLYTNKPFMKGEDGIYRSLGADGKAFTKDDITLESR